jgi:hypothetical protein
MRRERKDIKEAVVRIPEMIEIGNILRENIKIIN